MNEMNQQDWAIECDLTETNEDWETDYMLMESDYTVSNHYAE